MADRLRVGVDVVDIDSVADSVSRFGDSYLERVFTNREISDCTDNSGNPDPTRLAGRFAAKEAAFKVLRTDVEEFSWRSIEVVRCPGGWCDVEFSGEAADVASEIGLSDVSLSISHEAGIATAVVVAFCGDQVSESTRGQG